MNTLRIFALLSLFSLPAAAGPCAFDAAPTGVLREDGKLLQYWEVDDSPVWESGLRPDSDSYWRFARFIRSRLEPSAAIAVAPETGRGADSFNARLVRKRFRGKIRPARCLEILLLAMQAERKPMESEPTEFLSFILRKKGRLKIWFYTVDQAGIGRMGPIQEAAEKDVAAGWAPVANLHNHNFFLKDGVLQPAVPWPSAIDLQLMKGYSLGGKPFEYFAVTNGFETTRWRPEDLGVFRDASR